MLWSQSVPVECVRFSTALPTLLQYTYRRCALHHQISRLRFDLV